MEGDGASGVPAATRLHRETVDVQTELEQKRTEHRDRMGRVKERELALARRREELQAELIRYHKVVQENEIRRARAEKKAAIEEAAKEEKGRQAAEIAASTERLEDDHRALTAKLAKYLRYQKYMEGVLTISEEYQEPTDIITRHHTLDANNKELQERKHFLEREVEAQRTSLQRRRKAKEDEILELTNRLAKLQDAYEDTLRTTRQAQDQIEGSVEHKRTVLKTEGEVRMAILNLRDRCTDAGATHKKGVKAEPTEDILQQLSAVGECLSDYLYVVDRDKEHQKATRSQGP